MRCFLSFVIYSHELKKAKDGGGVQAKNITVGTNEISGRPISVGGCKEV